MKTKEFDVSGLRIASPCPVGWNAMQGNDRSRFCGLCELDVYNVAGLTAAEVESLITENTGRVCIRMFRRADGTVITKDCPVGRGKLRRRTARIASAALGTLLGLFSLSYGQKDDEQPVKPQNITDLAEPRPDAGGIISGIVKDVNGALIPGVTLELFREGEDRVFRKTNSNADGRFYFQNIPGGLYRVEISVLGFTKLVLKKISVQNDQHERLRPEMEPALVTEELIGVVGFADPVEIIRDDKPKISSHDQLTRLPTTRP